MANTAPVTRDTASDCAIRGHNDDCKAGITSTVNNYHAMYVHTMHVVLITLPVSLHALPCYACARCFINAVVDHWSCNLTLQPVCFYHSIHRLQTLMTHDMTIMCRSTQPNSAMINAIPLNPTEPRHDMMYHPLQPDSTQPNQARP